MIWSGVIVMATTLLLYLLFWKILLLRLGDDPQFQIKRPMLLYATWIAFICALGQSQVLTNTAAVPPRFLMLWIMIISSVVLFTRSETGTLLAAKTPLWILVGFQGFRILAEWTLFAGYQEGIIPIQMTFAGMNFDIISGVFALALIPVLIKYPTHQALAWVFNIVGLGLLLSITVIATLSFPSPIRYFFNEPTNIAVAYMPHILLPGVLVHAAFTGHFLLTKRLLTMRSTYIAPTQASALTTGRT